MTSVPGDSPHASLWGALASAIQPPNVHGINLKLPKMNHMADLLHHLHIGASLS